MPGARLRDCMEIHQRFQLQAFYIYIQRTDVYIAYFERAPDAVFGVIHRPWFEAQLREQFDSKAFNNDPSWYALKNTVYASGCRLELAKKAGFLEAYEKSWRYFENALSVQTELLYYRTGILAVQALTVMVSN